MEDNTCGICCMKNDKYIHTLKCGHKFHYECLIDSFKFDKSLSCPYCRSENNELPLVNGIKNTNKYYFEKNENYENIKCDCILKMGKNKGNKCNNYCAIGKFKCNRHLN
tara:strand:+ start:1047 stop:1373 length:327 start_codon:yes stop_codon:yes gene_type:complete